MKKRYYKSSNINDNVYYRGEIGIRKDSLIYAHSFKELEEYGRCYGDIIYFIENYILDKRDKKIKLLEYQKNMIKSYTEGNFNIFTGSKNMGRNVIMSYIVLHHLMFYNDYKICFVSSNKKVSKNVMKVIIEYYKSLPMFLKVGFLKKSNITYEFENGSMFGYCSYDERSFDLLSKNGSFDLYWLGDLSYLGKVKQHKFYRKIMKMFKSLNLNEHKINITTGISGSDFFNNLIKNGMVGSFGKIIKFNVYYNYWYDVPNRGDEYKQTIIEKYGLDVWNRDYDCIF